MIHRIVQFALRQRFLVLMVTVLIVIAGAISFQRMPVDAYPDLSPPMVELITQWPGHAAEEVERLTTLPLELAMNGTPRLEVMRSISLYGLSDVRLTFDEGVDPYFARQVVFQRLSDAVLPVGVTPSMAPLFSPSGLVYRYVLESPDRTPQELKTVEDWIIEREYRSVPGVADDSGFGGTTMQYQVLLDQYRLAGAGCEDDRHRAAVGRVPRGVLQQVREHATKRSAVGLDINVARGGDIEAQLAPDNYLFTPSLMFTVDCYTQTGINAAIKLNDRWTVLFGIHAGDDVAPWNAAAHPTAMAMFAYVQAIVVDYANGQVQGGSDPRAGGCALAG